MLASISVNRAEVLLDAYHQYLHMSIIDHGHINAALSALWNTSHLIGQRYWILTNKRGYPWLRVIEGADEFHGKVFQNTGWISMEVSVKNVDALAMKFRNSPFQIYRPPADLEFNNNIRAMQVIGPVGEVFYFTEIKKCIPSFDLQPAQCDIDRLFIPILSCHNRLNTLSFYEKIFQKPGLTFSTKLSAVNKAFNCALDTQYPIGLVQLENKNMIEIDQIDCAEQIQCSQHKLPAGISMISCYIKSFDHIMSDDTCLSPKKMFIPPYNGREVIFLKGLAGELLELIKNTSSQGDV